MLATADDKRPVYSGRTRLLHWAMAGLFIVQFALAWTMLRLDAEGRLLGLSQAIFYNWHKSLGLVAFVIAAMRVWNRRSAQLPPWATSLSAGEKRLIHRYEQVLYTLMFVLPVSGFVYVMAGGYGINLFGLIQLPNPLPVNKSLAWVAGSIHVVGAYLLLLALGLHIGLVLRHQLLLRDGLLRRML